MPRARNSISSPLETICVLDLSRLYPGAFCSRQLADLGARVIKIEEPGVGDFYREKYDESLFREQTIQAFNRGKESLSLNLKSHEGREILWNLIPKADVLLESFRPGTLARLGFSYEKLKQVHPGLIFCSLTGYGQTGPRSQEAGHDLNYIGLAGLLHSPRGTPSVPPFQIADLAGGGLYGAVAILAALYQREKSGQGTWIDLALAEGATSLAAPYLESETPSQSSAPAAYELLGGCAATYQLYQTKDKQWMALAPLEDKFWQNFERASSSKLNLCSGMDQKAFSISIKKRIARLMRQWTRAQWVRRAKKADLCLTPVHSHQEVLKEPQFRARKLFFRQRSKGRGLSWGVKSPFVFNERRLYRARQAPMRGQHNSAILKELGYDANQVKKLRRKGVL